MLELIMAAVLLDVADNGQGFTLEAVPLAQVDQVNEPAKDDAKRWAMPKLDYSGSGCEQFAQRQLDGFGNLKVGTPCPAKPAEEASKGRSMDKRN